MTSGKLNDLQYDCIVFIEFTAKRVPKSCCAKSQYGIYIDTHKCQNWIEGPPNLQSDQQYTNEALHYKVTSVVTMITYAIRNDDDNDVSNSKQASKQLYKHGCLVATFLHFY